MTCGQGYSQQPWHDGKSLEMTAVVRDLMRKQWWPPMEDHAAVEAVRQVCWMDVGQPPNCRRGSSRCRTGS